MQARIREIPVEEDATWGAVVAALLKEHREDWRVQWRRLKERDDASWIEIEAPGEDVDAMRAEIVEAVDLVNGVVRRDPLEQMVAIDPDLVEVLVD